MANLEEVRAAHPVEDRAAYDTADAEADLAGRIAAMAYGMRVAAGLSQSELARRMGTSQPAIARLENAGTVPGIEFLARLAASTGVELALTASGVAEVALLGAPATRTPAKKALAKKVSARKPRTRRTGTAALAAK